MPLALIASGLILIITGVQNTYAQMGAQIQMDGAAFLKWLVAIMAVGALGYVNELRQFSHWFLALILIAMVLSNKGFFNKFTAAINAGPTAPNAPASAPSSTTTQSTSTVPGITSFLGAGLQGLFSGIFKGASGQ